MPWLHCFVVLRFVYVTVDVDLSVTLKRWMSYQFHTFRYNIPMYRAWLCSKNSALNPPHVQLHCRGHIVGYTLHRVLGLETPDFGEDFKTHCVLLETCGKQIP